jgi:hypothetical protein
MVRYEECADYSSDDRSTGASQDEIGDDEADEIGRSENAVVETNGTKKEAL